MAHFSIRDLLWLMVVVAVVSLLIAERRNSVHWRAQSQQWESRAQSASSALNAADRQNAWQAGNVVVVEPAPISGVPIQKVYVPQK